jgi:diguanylate cyclase (GGDEF)-like protein/PAS domain S-box-containing protein
MRATPQRVTDRRSNPWPALALALVAVAIVMALELNREQERSLGRQGERLRVQALVVMNNLTRQLEGVKNGLEGVRDRVSPLNGAPLPEPVADTVKALAAAMPGIRGIMVLDSKGDVITTDSSDLARRNFADRAYFKAPQADPLYAKLYVSPPFRSLLGRYSLNLSSAIVQPGQRFGGVVTANLDAEYFETLAQSVLYAEDMHLSILHGDGALFLDAHLEAAQLPDAILAEVVKLSELAKSQIGQVIVVELGTDRDRRLVALGAIQPQGLVMDKPLLISASRQLSDLYAPLKQQAVEYGLIYFLLCAGIIATVYLLDQRSCLALEADQERQRIAAINAETLQFGLKSADLGFWEWNARTNTTKVNARELEILGYAEGEIEFSPQKWRELIPDDEWDVVRGAFRSHVKASSAAFSGEHRMCRKDGQLIWVQSHAIVAERDARNRPLRIVGTHLDISESKASEKAMTESAHRLELAIETGKIGLLDLDVLAGTMILNPGGLEIAGWSRTLDKPVTLDRWRALIHPDDLGRAVAAFEPVRAGERASHACEYRLRHCDGQYVWVHMRARAVQLGPDGTATRIVGAFRDITETKAAEAHLASAIEVQRRTGKLAKVGGWQFDLNSREMSWSDELYEIHELTPQPVTLESSIAFYEPMARARLRSAVETCVKDGTAWCIDAEIVTGKGNALWVRTQGEAVMVGGAVVKLVGASQDITERIQYAGALEAANQRLEKLTLTDGLTNVGNRRLVDQTLRAEWQRCGRTGQSLGLMMVDIDYFKAYNDTYGHQQGDEALIRVAEILQRCVQRSGEVVARYGGEEFVVLSPGADRGDVARLANVFAALMAQANLPHAASPVARVVTVSIGIAAVVPTATDEPAMLLALADTALYDAKKQGRNRIAHAVQDAPPKLGIVPSV